MRYWIIVGLSGYLIVENFMRYLFWVGLIRYIKVERSIRSNLRIIGQISVLFVIATFKFSFKNCAFSQLEVFKIWLEAGTTADLRKKFGRSAIQHLSIWAIQQFSIEAIQHPDSTAVWSSWATAASQNTCSLCWYWFCLHLVWTKSWRGAAERPTTARLLQGEEGDFLSESDQPKLTLGKLST